MALGSTKEGKQQLKRRLGRGLDSLLGSPVKVDIATQPPPDATSPKFPTTTSQPPSTPIAQQEQAIHIDHNQYVHMLAPNAIRPNTRQPRQDFDEAALASLASSIQRDGMMQPIIVRPVTTAGGGDARYELIAGERRWRAAKRLDLQAIPAIVRDIDDQQAAEWSLVENLQREDLNPIERAEAFRRLITEFSLSHQDIADRVGLERSSISNHLRMLDLEPSLRDVVRQGMLNMGHAKALLSITNFKDRERLAGQAVREGLSVREVERRAKQLIESRQRGVAAVPGAGGGDKSPRLAQLEQLQRQLSQHLGTNVRIHTGQKKGTGKLVIDFYNLDQFDGLLQRMGFRSAD